MGPPRACGATWLAGSDRLLGRTRPVSKSNHRAARKRAPEPLRPRHVEHLMLATRTATACAVIVVMTVACEKRRATWTPRPPVPQPPVQLVGGIPVAMLNAGIPLPTDGDVRGLVQRAQEERKDHRARRIDVGRMHPSGGLYAVVHFGYHTSRERIRRSYSVGMPYKNAHSYLSLVTQVEVCAPGRSFLNKNTVPSGDLVSIDVEEALSDEEIVEVVDAVYDSVPAGEKLLSIVRDDSGVYRVRTGHAPAYQPLSGSVLEAERRVHGWSVVVVAKWVS